MSRSSNDDRSDTLNPNNDAYHYAQLNQDPDDDYDDDDDGTVFSGFSSRREVEPEIEEEPTRHFRPVIEEEPPRRFRPSIVSTDEDLGDLYSYLIRPMKIE